MINVPQFCFLGLAGEDTTVKFQSVTGLSPIVSDLFPKIIGLVLEDKAISGHEYKVSIRKKVNKD